MMNNKSADSSEDFSPLKTPKHQIIDSYLTTQWPKIAPKVIEEDRNPAKKLEQKVSICSR